MMLKEHQDAYGFEIFDHFRGEEVFEIVEREDGYIDASSGPRYYFLDYEDWPLHHQEAIKFAQGRVLDIGCGAGRVSLYLQEKGHNVLGIDISPKAVEVCRERGLSNIEILSITQISSKLGQFDTIVMLGNNFGLFANPSRAKWLLRRFHGMTSDEGCILAESNDIYTTDEPVHLAYQESNRQRGRMSGQIRLRIRHKRMKTPWFDYLMVSKDEMEAILLGTGWRITKIFKSEGSNYIALIEKVT
jgi:SAM-dependent methyltransferase